MSPPDRLVTDTDVLRDHARHMTGTADSLRAARDTFAPGGAADIPGDAFRSRTG